MLFTDWHDFVVYPKDPNRVRSRQDRLDTGSAKRTSPGAVSAAAIDPAAGYLVERTQVELTGDPFQAMVVTEVGDVCIWTTTRVWFLLRRHGGMEKLLTLSRDPPTE